MSYSFLTLLCDCVEHILHHITSHHITSHCAGVLNSFPLAREVSRCQREMPSTSLTLHSALKSSFSSFQSYFLTFFVTSFQYFFFAFSLSFFFSLLCIRLALVWQVTKSDISSTITAVCNKVMHDHSASYTTRQERREGAYRTVLYRTVHSPLSCLHNPLLFFLSLLFLMSAPSSFKFIQSCCVSTVI
jgi:X-domain of DnaJ-containing